LGKAVSDNAPWEDYASPAGVPAAVPAANETGPWSDYSPSTAAEESTTPFQDAWGAAKHQLGQAAKAVVNAATALPMMAMDTGVAVRNLGSNLSKGITPTLADFNPFAKTGGTPQDTELPSSTWHKGMNDIFGAPQNTAERVNDVALPMLLGAGAASEGAPAAIRSVMGGPEVAEQAPANFVSPDTQKQQLLAQTIKRGQDLGLVVPPRTTNPNAFNATVETIGGKIATQQAASVKNQPIANTVAARELGLNPDAPLTPGAVKGVISDAGKGYEAVRNVGKVATDDDYLNTLMDVSAKAAGPAASFPGSKPSPLLGEIDSLLQSSFDASHAVDKIAELRDSSSMAYRAGDTRLGSGYRQLSNALEDQIDRSISKNPDVDPATVTNFRASRVLAAKAHSVLEALNPATGDVSMRSLATSDDPLTGGLRTLADFARAAPRATQDVSKIGSSGVSHLDVLGPLLTGAIGEQAAGPWGMAASVGYPLAREGAKRYALGPGQAAAIPKAAATGSPKTAAAAVQATESDSGDSDDDKVSRATGGKVDHEALVERLIQKWKSAKRETDKSTKPLLKVPDAAIVRALDIAQEHI
jgi:hypothetical protein